MIHDSGLYEPLLVKGDPLHYWQSLITALKKNKHLVEKSFHTVLSGDKGIDHHNLQPGDYVFGKDIF